MKARESILVEARYARTGIITLGAIFSVGIFLIFLSLPLFFAEVAAGQSRYTLNGLEPVKYSTSPDKLRQAATEMNSATLWMPQNRKYAEGRISLTLGIYEHYVTIGEGHSRKARRLLASIDDQIVTALTHSPASSNLWYLLSETRVRLAPHDHRIFDYLKMSYMTGPREGWIASRRLAFALKNWNQLDLDNQRFAEQDIRLLWAEQPYRKYLAAIFLKTTRSGKKLIYRHINDGGYEEVLKFRASLRKLGWKSKNALLYEVMLN
ncbi:MAG: hypothetical protein ACRBBN_15600 [Methyloligellaceae bacterium]